MTRARLHTTLDRRQTAAIIGTLVAALTLAGCGSGDDSTGGGERGGSDKSTNSSPKAFNDADVAFSSGMIGHHRQAVEMAEMVLARGVTPTVKDLARRIKAAQSPEITTLCSFLTTFGQPVPSADAGHGTGGGHTGPGIMSPEEMARLETLSGKELEKAFLTDMIEHHLGAVEMATTELAAGKYTQAKALAEQIKAAQVGEISEMKELLKQYP